MNRVCGWCVYVAIRCHLNCEIRIARMQLRFIANYKNNHSALRMHYQQLSRSKKKLYGECDIGDGDSVGCYQLLKMHVIFNGCDQLTRHAKA